MLLSFSGGERVSNMLFNFPNKEERVLVNIQLKPEMFRDIRDIAEKEECLRAETILVLLETAITEYKGQKNKPKEVAFPVKPNAEVNPDEIKTVKKEEPEITPESKKTVGWSLKFDACIKCGTTERKHMGKGKCSRCYFVKKKAPILVEVKKELPKKIKKYIPLQIQEKYVEAEKQADTLVKALVRYCQNQSCPKPQRKYIDNSLAVDYVILDQVFHFCNENCKVAYLQQDNRYGYEPVNYSMVPKKMKLIR